jgi:DNA ligase D-like protein (predicted 3'-phosphoesterase)
MKRRDSSRLVFTPDAVLRRIDAHGDLFAPVLRQQQQLPTFQPEACSAAPLKKTLRKYHEMRNFSITPEPTGGAPSAKGYPRFVIQKHAASHLSDGVLKSWAVPKGPSTQLGIKRLAMRTEDHPMDYADFEGRIPKGEYGGGTVMVWDRGSYVNLTQKNGKLIPLAAGLAKGHIDFWLQGSKLNGGWSLIRMGPDEKHWLLVKAKDEGVNFPPHPVRDDVRSAKTGRTMEQIAADQRSSVWHSNRAA